VAEEASLGDAGEAEAKVPVMLFCRGCGRFGAPSRKAEVLREAARGRIAGEETAGRDWNPGIPLLASHLGRGP
jgi:hypothetical protein